MNTVIFYTRSKFCEQSPVVSSCRDIKYCLTELLSNYVTTDLDINLEKSNELIAFGSESTPWVVILNEEGGLVYAFGIDTLNEIINSEDYLFNTHEEYLEVLKLKTEQILIEYGAL